MVFSSLFFVFAFLPLNLLLYFAVKNTAVRNAIMLVFSLVFYAWGEPKYVLLLIAMSFIDWLMSLIVEKYKAVSKAKAKAALIAACVADLGLLGVFKYGTFFQENLQAIAGVPDVVTQIALPIGISFYTFQLLTYVVDVYRDDVKAEKNFFNVLLYASLFHQCVAGPIVRYQDIAQQIKSRTINTNGISRGIIRFSAGLAKKALLANSCGAMADTLLLSDAAAADLSSLSSNIQVLASRPALALWLGMLFYMLQIYLDFSAYSDMAIGMGQMTGFHYKENFDYPYCSHSITEFWRRWHISLGSFFRDYVYIPLGGNRKSLPRTIINLFITWLLTGFWHGASWNYVLWGLYYFVFLAIEKLFLHKLLEKTPKPISSIYTLVVVFFGWVLFKFERLPLVWTVLKGMFCMNANSFTNYEAGIMLKSNIFLLIVACIACVPIAKYAKKGITELAMKFGASGATAGWVLTAIYPCVMLILSTAALVGNSYNPFLYFQF